MCADKFLQGGGGGGKTGPHIREASGVRSVTHEVSSQLVVMAHIVLGTWS